MKVAIIGHTGFVGSHLHRIYPDAVCFNSKNIAEIEHKTFDLVFCAGVSAVKYLANQNPEDDLAQIDSLFNHLKEMECKKNFVLISTIDVYTLQISNTKEEDNEENQLFIPNNEVNINPQIKEAYGRNRYNLEIRLKQLFDSRLIVVRLPGLFGFGLKKNILFDLIQKEKKVLLNPNSKFQWYNLEWLQQDLDYIIKNELKLVNMFPCPITNKDLMEQLKHLKPNFEFNDNDKDLPVIEYNIQTLFANNKSNYWRSKKASLESIKRFMEKSMLESRIVVSSLTCSDFETKAKQFNITNIEIAPWSFFGKDDEFIKRPLEHFQSFVKPNQKIYSFQSLFYPFNWKLDCDYNLILSYLMKLIDIAYSLGSKILVFGSPKLRSVPNAKMLMRNLLTSCNDHINGRDVYICMEPNASHYGCNFLTNAKDTFDFVSSLALSNIKMMLDTGNMYLEKEDEDILFKYGIKQDIFYHVHFSAPDLIALSRWQQRFGFNFLKQKLISLGYKHNFTIECLNIASKDLTDSLYEIYKDINFTVVGAGWFGCSITDFLVDNGYNVSLLEKQSTIFNNVSSHNQNRLHLSFHYPRSFKTRKLCKDNYGIFLDNYGAFVDFIDRNYYMVSTESCIDFETYKQIMSGIDFEESETCFKFQNVDKSCLKVKEGIIDFRRAKAYFEFILKRNIFCLTECIDLNSLDKTKWVLDCTYNELQKVPGMIFEDSLSLIYRQVNKDDPPIAVTVVDGPFFSLYPYDLPNRLYTLTHVSKGRTANFELKDIEEDVKRYFPTFLQEFQLVDWFISKKCLIENSSCSSRHLLVSHVANKTSAVCGKITGIFDFRKEIVSILS